MSQVAILQLTILRLLVKGISWTRDIETVYFSSKQYSIHQQCFIAILLTLILEMQKTMAENNKNYRGLKFLSTEYGNITPFPFKYAKRKKNNLVLREVSFQKLLSAMRHRRS